jgi:hypothetical protein
MLRLFWMIFTGMHGKTERGQVMKALPATIQLRFY